MQAENQLYYFALCLIIGFSGGILYEPFSLIRLLLGGNKPKYKWLAALPDILFFACFWALTTACAYLFHFPDFRVYMWIGYAVGLGLYLKTLRRILAFCEKVCYNKLVKVLKKAKSKKNTHTEVEYDAR